MPNKDSAILKQQAIYFVQRVYDRKNGQIPRENLKIARKLYNTITNQDSNDVDYHIFSHTIKIAKDVYGDKDGKVPTEELNNCNGFIRALMRENLYSQEAPSNEQNSPRRLK